MSVLLAAAQTIVLTKIDQVNLDVWEQAEREAKAINPLTTIVSEPSRTIRARVASKDTDTVVQLPLPADAEIPIIKRVLLHPRVRVLRAKFAAAAEWDDVLDWLENVSGALGERLLRMKARSLADRRHDVAWSTPEGIEPGMKPMCSALENMTFTLASTKTGLGKTLG